MGQISVGVDTKKAVAQGKSPAHEKQREKRRPTATKTFGDVANKWLADARMADSTKATLNRVTQIVAERAKAAGLPLEPFTVHDLRRIPLCQFTTAADIRYSLVSQDGCRSSPGLSSGSDPGVPLMSKAAHGVSSCFNAFVVLVLASMRLARQELV